MRKILMAFAGLALVGAAVTDAEADSSVDSSIYLSAFGGANWLKDIDDHDFCDDADSCDEFDAEYDLGFVVGGALGARFDLTDNPLGFRIEAKVAYRQNEGDELPFDLDTAPFDCASATVGPCDLFGDKTALTAMGNVWLDFTLGNPVSVFVGGGVGGAWVSLNDGGSTNPALEPFSLLEANDTDLVFAYQAGAGISVSLPIGAELTVQYRYFGTDDPEFGTLAAFESFSGLDNVHSDSTAHSAMVGIRVPLN